MPDQKLKLNHFSKSNWKLRKHINVISPSYLFNSQLLTTVLYNKSTTLLGRIIKKTGFELTYSTNSEHRIFFKITRVDQDPNNQLLALTEFEKIELNTTSKYLKRKKRNFLIFIDFKTTDGFIFRGSFEIYYNNKLSTNLIRSYRKILIEGFEEHFKNLNLRELLDYLLSKSYTQRALEILQKFTDNLQSKEDLRDCQLDREFKKYQIKLIKLKKIKCLVKRS